MHFGRNVELKLKCLPQLDLAALPTKPAQRPELKSVKSLVSHFLVPKVMPGTKSGYFSRSRQHEL